MTSGSKVYFCHVSWRPSWIYANSKYCPKWAPGQPSWDCSRTPKEYKSSKNVTEESISRSHNEFKNRSNHFKVMNANGSFCLVMQSIFDLSISLYVWIFAAHSLTVNVCLVSESEYEYTGGSFESTIADPYLPP